MRFGAYLAVAALLIVSMDRLQARAAEQPDRAWCATGFRAEVSVQNVTDACASVTLLYTVRQARRGLAGKCYQCYHCYRPRERIR